METENLFTENKQLKEKLTNTKTEHNIKMKEKRVAHRLAMKQFRKDSGHAVTYISHNWFCCFI